MDLSDLSDLHLQVCELMFYNGKVISVDPPQFVDLVVGSLGVACSNAWE